MALFDLPLTALREYRPELAEPEGFDAFWADTLEEARSHEVLLDVADVDTGLELVEAFDVTFAGHGGSPVRAWYLRPAAARGPLPVVVEYIGYGGGRGLPHEHLLWPSAGYAHLVMDTRGQGGAWGSGGATEDPAGSGPAAPGSMTRGILSPHTAYLARLETDAARAVDAARALPGTDGRVAVTGNSQGGGLSIAAAGLVPDVAAAMPNVPFLCAIRRAVDVTDAEPYQEIVRFLAANRTAGGAAGHAPARGDGVPLGRRAQAPALFSAALRDMTVPPSTVFAAANHWGGATDGPAPAVEVEVYPYNGHEGGAAAQQARQLAWLPGVMPLAAAR